MRTCVFDTRTGDLVLDVTGLVSGASWSAKLDGSGQGSVTVQLREQGIDRATARNVFRANARMVAHIHDDGTVIAGGVFMVPKYSRDSGVLTAAWVDVRRLLAKRMGFGVAHWNSSGTLTVTGRSLSGAARAIVSRAMSDGDPASWALPIDLPADGSGSFTRTWPYYAFQSMDDCLLELEDEGAEIFFDPTLDDGQLRFATRVGKPISLASADLPVTTPESAVLGLEVTEDGSRQVTGVIYAGNGTDADQLTAWAGSGPSDGQTPIIDAYRAAKDIKSASQLQRIADADLAGNTSPVEQWSFGVRLDDDVTAAMVKPGRRLRMDLRGDDWIADGVTTQRVIGVSGDLTRTVKLEVQSYGG